jgi:hypothetical protein
MLENTNKFLLDMNQFKIKYYLIINIYSQVKVKVYVKEISFILLKLQFLRK